MSLAPHPRNGVALDKIFNVPRGKLWGGVIAVAVLFSAILLANWVTTDYGFIPVGFGLEATAGTIFAGFALAARDAIQDTWGRIAIVLIILVGTGVSFAISAPAIAIASAVAFLVSETLNFAVYTPIRTRAKFGDKKWAGAVVLSNIAGAISDTIVFLGIAFGLAAIMPALPGQLVGKMYATVVYLLIGKVIAMVLAHRKNQRMAEHPSATQAIPVAADKE